MRTFVLVVAALLAGPFARAETVQVVSGPNELAQGWLYLASDGRCKVLTAGHVVARDGKPIPVIVRDRRQRQLETQPPEIFSLSPDIAILPVRTGASAKECSPSRLSLIGIDRRAQQLKEGSIERAALSEIGTYRVVRVASAIDKSGGEFLAVRPADAAVRFGQGWSGAMLLDDEGPLGIVFAAEEREASIVRLDVLARLSPLRQAGGAIGPAPVLTVLAGETADPATGPSGVFDPARLPWRVSPARGRVEFTLAYQQPRALRGLAVMLEGSPRLRSIEMLAGVGDDQFISLRTCRAGAPAAALACQVAEQTRVRMKIVLEVAGDEPVDIRSLRVD